MYQLKSPTGQAISIPETVEEDLPYFSSVTDEARRYYQDQGYVVLRGLVPRALTAAARAGFAAEVKPYDGFIYRQTTAKAERHSTNAQGWVMNPVLNVQSVSARKFPGFRQSAMACLTSDGIKAAVSAILGEAPKIVQTMYFEGNTATWPHQDTYYLDSEQIGTMCAAWVALEDIAPNAGRFFVCPGSHKIDLAKNGGDFDIAYHHDRYKALVVELMTKFDLKVVAPALQEGDVLLWNAKTLHGSLESPGAKTSRQSLTAHYIPQSHGFLQLQARVLPLSLEPFGGIGVSMTKSQDRLLNRAILAVEGYLPFLFYPLKNAAVKFVTDRANARSEAAR